MQGSVPGQKVGRVRNKKIFQVPWGIGVKQVGRVGGNPEPNLFKTTQRPAHMQRRSDEQVCF